MNPWWAGLPPAQAAVACGEQLHRLRWESGALAALDHSDPEAERTLAALGGTRCTCVDVLDAWARHDGDPRVLVLASRGPGDPLAVEDGWTAQLGSARPALIINTPGRVSTRELLRRPGRRRAMAAARPRLTPRGPYAPSGQMSLRTQPESDLVALLGLGGGLGDRLVATVAAAWAARFDRPDEALARARPQLHASMHGRLASALRGWLGRTDLEIELDLIEDRSPPTLTDVDGVIRAKLPFAWLADVWSRGLSITWGRFCLAAATEDGRAWTLTTVGPDLGEPAPVRIELPE